MEQAASVLRGFPPSNPVSSDKQYDRAIEQHKSDVIDLLEKPQYNMQQTIQLLELLDPAVHSLSYLLVLDALLEYDGISAEQRGVFTIQFLTSFDARQIRYAGHMFLNYLGQVILERFILPNDVKVGLLANAILRIDPTGSMLTTSHYELVNLAYDTDNADSAFCVIDKRIVYFPGMESGYTNLLCDMSSSPPDYINYHSGLTEPLDVQTVLVYDYMSGLLYLTRGQWKKARDAFERVIVHPTRDGGVSTVMTDTYNKWLLASLLVDGHTPQTPSNVGLAASKMFASTGKPYLALAAHFDAMTAVELKRDVDAHPQLWRDDRNSGLVHNVLAAHQKWQIMDLRNVYSKIAISQIRETTCSAETGEALPSDGDVERLIQGMIDSKMLNGCIKKPEGKPAYLEFLAEVEELTEVEYKKEIAATTKRLRELGDMYSATNARLGTNPQWLKHVIREKKREKDNEVGQTMVQLSTETLDDDEDLMTDLIPSGM